MKKAPASITCWMGGLPLGDLCGKDRSWDKFIVTSCVFLLWCHENFIVTSWVFLWHRVYFNCVMIFSLWCHEYFLWLHDYFHCVVMSISLWHHVYFHCDFIFSSLWRHEYFIVTSRVFPLWLSDYFNVASWVFKFDITTVLLHCYEYIKYRKCFYDFSLNARLS